MLSFRDLCHGFCAIKGLQAPVVDTGRAGLEAFTLEVDGISPQGSTRFA
jgi:hypothetical protein